MRNYSTLLLLFLAGWLGAQEAEVHGLVTDATGEPLIGATVRVVGSVIGDATDLDGHYQLSVPPGRIRLLVSYIGFENVDTVLRISVTDRDLEVNLVLQEQFVDAGEVIVIGQRAFGQAQALRLQQSSSVPQTIIHSELFNKYPDITLAETVQRMPGVTITRNRGEGELVQVRGLPEQYTAISLNGQRLPAVQPEADRAGSLDIIQSNLVEEVRVIKARSADLDGDAIGGTVDFHLRQPEQQFEVLVQAGAGSNFGFDQNPGQSTRVTQAAAVLNSELNDETVYGLAAGSYFSHARGNRTRRFDYGEDGVTGTRISRVRPIDTDRMTRKYGLLGAVELRPSIYNRMRLSYNYSALDEEVFTREANFSRDGDILENRIATRGTEERSFNMVTLEVENNFSKTKLDYTLSFASTSERINDRQRAFNTGRGINPGDGLSDDEFAALLPTSTAYAGDLERSNSEQLNLDLEEDVAIGGFNLTRYVDRSRTSFLKVGARYRIKERTFRQFYGRDSLTRTPGVAAGAFADLSREALLELDPDLSVNLANYTAEERIAAGYLMYVNNWTSRFTSSLGLRYEKTDFEYERNVQAQADSLDYDNLFPSLNLTYRFKRERQLRFSYYGAIARVPYATLVPTQLFDERRQAQLDIYNIGNPNVDPTTSQNFDLTFERYGRRDGLISVSTYAKRLISPTVRTARYDVVAGQPSLGYSLRNTPDATLLGVELGVYQNLGFLRTDLRHLSVNGTLNVNSYSLDTGGGPEDGTLAQAPRRSANLSLVYSNPKQRLNLVVAGNYRSSTLDLIQEGQPIWVNSVISLDLAADLEIIRDISAYVRLNNLTDHGFERYIGKPDEAGALPTSTTQYGVWGVAGLRWRPR